VVTPLSSKTSKQALINCFENIYSNHFTTFIYIKRKEKRNPNTYMHLCEPKACTLSPCSGQKEKRRSFHIQKSKGNLMVCLPGRERERRKKAAREQVVRNLQH